MWTIIELISKNPEISLSSRNNPEMSQRSSDVPMLVNFSIYVSLHLPMQNAVPAQPCVGKLGISLVLLNFLHCNFRLWFKTPLAFESYPCHASEMTRNTLNHCLKFALHSIFCHICYGKISEKMSTLSLKLSYSSPRHQTAVFKVFISFKCS